MAATNESIWLATSQHTDYPRLSGELEVDVAVVGGGVTGLTTALLMQAEGASVAVLEARRLALGSSGYNTGKVTPLQGATYSGLEQNVGLEAARTYAEANAAAMEEVARLVEAHGIDCRLERRDNHTYGIGVQGRRKVEEEANAARRAGLDVDLVEPEELPFDALAVRLTDQVQYNPHRYCAGLAEAITAAGGQIFEETTIVDVDDGATHFRLRSRDGAVVRAKWVVVATLLPFLDRGGFFAKTRPSRTYLMAFHTPQGPAVEQMYLGTGGDRHTLRGYDEWTLIGGSSHRVGQEPDTERCYAKIERWAEEHFGLRDPSHRWSAQDYIAVDDLPYIGRMPRGRDELLVATGMRKWGLTNGTVAAMILRDHLADRPNGWAETFRATRVDVKGSAKSFVRDNLEVAVHFVKDRIENPTETTLDAIGPGQGGVVSEGGEKVACFRDDDGQLHRLSPVCPHMGCHLTWNTAEKSWDCPCHGSRFQATGERLEGPAVEDMSSQDEGS